MNLNLPILQNEQTSLPQFIDFWSSLYEDPEETLYTNNIDKVQYSGTDVTELFEWKNGMPLSQTKLESLHKKIIAKLEIINQFKNDPKVDLNAFIKEFNDLSFVWKIFLLHIIKPKAYPIYDQNIHRCFNFIRDMEHQGITNNIPEKSKEQFYFEDYLPFIENLNGIPMQKIDRAFFSFGQFLNTRNYHQMLD
jgi:hypothetical protein